MEIDKRILERCMHNSLLAAAERAYRFEDIPEKEFLILLVLLLDDSYKALFERCVSNNRSDEVR